MQSRTEEKRVASDGERKEVEIREEKVIEIERMLLFYTGTTGICQQVSQMKRLEHTNITEDAAYFRWARLSYSEPIESVDYKAPGEVNTRNSGWKSLVLKIRRLLEKRVC